ncbi:MAG: peptide chain release factor N(5)-glutamine methyltransferase [bacterium]|nr:peptide chain release factor N(5)-glutamine methyltransferase [bacterium]
MEHMIRKRQDLLAHVLRRDQTWVLTHPDTPLTAAQQRDYDALIARLDAGEPLAYLLGEQWFYGRPFTVTRDTLIPRPETEQLITLALERADSDQFVDVGTGSGAIAVTIAAEIADARVLAIDISPAALAVARANATRHRVTERMTFVAGNLLAPLAAAPDDLDRTAPLTIIANLPYGTTDEWPTLSSSITHYEPRIAIDGGPDGLDPYRAFFAQLHELAVGRSAPCTALLEIDPRRRDVLAALVARTLPHWQASWHRDLAGHWRVLELHTTP